MSGVNVCLRERGGGFYGEAEGRLAETREPFLLSVAYVERINDDGDLRVDGFASVGFPPRMGTKWGEPAMTKAPVLEFKTTTKNINETIDVIREFLSRKLGQSVLIVAQYDGGKEGES